MKNKTQDSTESQQAQPALPQYNYMKLLKWQENLKGQIEGLKRVLVHMSYPIHFKDTVRPPLEALQAQSIGTMIKSRVLQLIYVEEALAELTAIYRDTGHRDRSIAFLNPLRHCNQHKNYFDDVDQVNRDHPGFRARWERLEQHIHSQAQRYVQECENSKIKLDEKHRQPHSA